MERNRIIVLLLGILTLIAVGFVLKVAQAVILPLIVAWLLSYILGPVVALLTRRRVPAGVAVLIVLILLAGVCYLGVVFANARLNAFQAAFPGYRPRLTQLHQSLVAAMDIPALGVGKMDWGHMLASFLMTLPAKLVTFVSKLVLVLIFLVFMLLGKPFFKYKIKKAFEPAVSDSISRVLGVISRQIGRYLTVQLLVSLLTGVLVWLALALLGVDFAVTWGALAFFLNFIPTVGSIAASIPPILLALVQFYPNYWMGVACAASLLAIHNGIGNLLTPKIMGDKLNLSPVVILLSLVFWGWLWGVVGALLSVPIAAIIKIVCENVEPLKPISILMGSGRPLQRELEERGTGSA
jgi:predicted PurR-regulated permease PerM